MNNEPERLLTINSRSIASHMTFMLSLITLAAAAPALNKRSSTQLVAFVNNDSFDMNSSGSVHVNLGFEQAVLNFNCRSSNWDASCQMVKCGYTAFGTLVNCTPSLQCGQATSNWDSSINRETVSVYYEATESSVRCAMLPF